MTWTRLLFGCGVELTSDAEGITIITGGGSMRLTNEQLSAIGPSVREHLDSVGGCVSGEVDTNSRAWKRAYYGNCKWTE